MRHAPLKRLFLPVFAAAVLAGCVADVPVTQMTPPQDTLIAVNDPALKDKATARVSYTGLYEHAEYVRYENGGLTLEAVYDVVIDDPVILDYHYTLGRMVDTWNLNAGQAKAWGSRGTARGWHDVIDYQLYTLTAQNRHCAAFAGEWDLSGRDPFGRPMEVVFGYACAKSGEALSADRVEALLKSVRIDRRFGHTFVKPGMQATFDPAAYAIATGSAQPGTGNAKFPFDFGTTYSEGEGDSISD